MLTAIQITFCNDIFTSSRNAQQHALKLRIVASINRENHEGYVQNQCNALLATVWIPRSDLTNTRWWTDGCKSKAENLCSTSSYKQPISHALVTILNTASQLQAGAESCRWFHKHGEHALSPPRFTNCCEYSNNNQKCCFLVSCTITGAKEREVRGGKREDAAPTSSAVRRASVFHSPPVYILQFLPAVGFRLHSSHSRDSPGELRKSG